MVQRFTLTTYLFFIYSLLFSQIGGSISLKVLGGGNLSYAFNSISKYKMGIIDPSRTTVGISVDDNADPAYLGWKLEIEFDDVDVDGFLTGSGGNKLSFSTVEVSTNLIACAGCTELAPGPPNLPLTNVAQILVQGGDGPGGADDIPPTLIFTTDQIVISYYIGTNPCPCPPGNALLGQPADFYTDDIILTLTMY